MYAILFLKLLAVWNESPESACRLAFRYPTSTWYTLHAACHSMHAGCGNANDSLHFHTLSGELVVRRPQAQHLDAHAHGANQELTTVVTASAQQQGASTAEIAAQPPMQDAACRTMPASTSTSMNALELQMSLPCADPDDPVPEVASDPWASPLLQGMLGQLAGAVEDIKYCAKLGYLLVRARYAPC